MCWITDFKRCTGNMRVFLIRYAECARGECVHKRWLDWMGLTVKVFKTVSYRLDFNRCTTSNNILLQPWLLC